MNFLWTRAEEQVVTRLISLVLRASHFQCAIALIGLPVSADAVD